MLGNTTAECKALEQTYDGLMDTFEYETVLTENGAVRSVSKQILTGVPCALSVDKKPDTSQTDSYAGMTQTFTVFCAPEISISAGSRVQIVQYGVVRSFRSSGTPAVYPTHQEISVLLEEKA